MTSPFTKTLCVGLFALGTVVAGAEENEVEKLQRENRTLKLQLANLREGYAKALTREDSKTEALKEINSYMALRGKDLFEDRDTRLLNAVADYEVAREELMQLQSAASQLLPSLQNYLRTAVASNPEARREVEAKIRELEVALKLRQQPKRKVEQGTARQARVVTIDSNTGAIVINAGSGAEISVGSKFRIERSGTHIGNATVAVVRPDVSGLLMQSLSNPEVSVQPGDLAKIILNSDPTN